MFNDNYVYWYVVHGKLALINKVRNFHLYLSTLRTCQTASQYTSLHPQGIQYNFYFIVVCLPPNIKESMCQQKLAPTHCKVETRMNKQALESFQSSMGVYYPWYNFDLKLKT